MTQSQIVASEAELNIVDTIKAQQLQKGSAVSVYRNRMWDGFRPNHRDNCFAFYEKDGGELLHIAPVATQNRPVMAT